MAEFNRDDVQGDLFSRGFPKFNEVYYFFHIRAGKEKEFSQKVKLLVSGEEKHISSINKVLEDWKKVDAAAAKNHATDDPAQKEWVPTSNALIAFSKPGLDRVSDQPLRFSQPLTQADSDWFDVGWPSKFRPKIPELVGSHLRYGHE